MRNERAPPARDLRPLAMHHPRFGEGRILSREGSGTNLKLTIHFSAHGTRKILPAYTKFRFEVR